MSFVSCLIEPYHIDPGTTTGGVYQTIRIRSDWRGSTMDSLPDGDTNDSFENIYFFVLNDKLMKQEATETAAVEFLENVKGLQFLYYDTNNTLITNPDVNHTSISRVDITILMQSSGSSLMTFKSSVYLRQR